MRTLSDNRFGHNIGWNDISRLPEDESHVIYYSCLYLAPDKSSSEVEFLELYLSGVSDIYYLLVNPEGLFYCPRIQWNIMEKLKS